ncbi:NYN domain-containing protein [Marinicrinis sediminis]|uniref:NYN domain-containing protein n=1 Tax=Marinicrinis sediminis TaxID=1652465 RepID=A0ABW5RCZ1_9BACL
MVQDILIVDGYNMIGAWPSLAKLAENHLEDARDELISQLANYQGYSGMKVILVFDAHQVPGLGKRYNQLRVDVRYTKEKETADECIEKLVYEWMSRRTRIYVATSDFVEQHVIFGKGALRISARELHVEVMESQKQLRNQLQASNKQRWNSFENKINLDVKMMLEKWRRGK